MFVPGIESNCNNVIRIIDRRNIKMSNVEKERQLFIRVFWSHNIKEIKILTSLIH